MQRTQRITAPASFRSSLFSLRPINWLSRGLRPFLLTILSIVTLFTLTLATGCQKPTLNKTPELSQTFSCQADFQYGDWTAKATLKRLGGGVWEAQFQEPASLAGVLFAYDGAELNASFLGLSFTVPMSALPDSSMLSDIFTALDRCTTGAEMPCEAVEEDGDQVYVYKGELSRGAYTVAMTKDNALHAFSLPSAGLTVAFSEYSAGLPETKVSDSVSSSENGAESSASESNSTESGSSEDSSGSSSQNP